MDIKPVAYVVAATLFVIPQAIGFAIHKSKTKNGQKTSIGILSMILCCCCGCFIVLCFPVDADKTVAQPSMSPPAATTTDVPSQPGTDQWGQPQGPWPQAQQQNQQW